MKKIFTAAVLLISSGIATAQSSDDSDNREKFQVGIKAGLNYSNVYDEQDEDFKTDAKFGAATGLFMEIPFGKYFGLKPEIVFSQKGFKANGGSPGNEYSFTRTTSFIDIPLQFELKPSEFFTILVGPQYSYLINQRDVFSNSTTSTVHEEDFRNDNYRKNVFGMVAGLDINLKHITLGARIGYDLQNNHGDGTSSTPRYKNTWFQGTIGYKLYK